MARNSLICREKNRIMSLPDKNESMRERSGRVQINSKLVSFLYELMRDHLPAATVEELIRASEDESNVVYTNGWLAQYAQDLANRLKDQ
jgi:hypothetical protein